MTESDIKARLCRMLREKAAELSETYLVLRHEDSVITGLPDISVTAYGWTSWWEVKYGNPAFETTEAQKLMCRKLAIAGYCRFIIFRETANRQSRMTAIVNPANVTHHDSVSGFNFEWVVNYIREVQQRWE